MKKLIFLFFFFVGWCSFAQKIEITTLLKDPISIRAIQIWDGKVWYTGTDSKFGFVSIKDSLDKKQRRLSNEKLQFRTLAQNKKHFNQRLSSKIPLKQLFMMLCILEKTKVPLLLAILMALADISILLPIQEQVGRNWRAMIFLRFMKEKLLSQQAIPILLLREKQLG